MDAPDHQDMLDQAAEDDAQHAGAAAGPGDASPPAGPSTGDGSGPAGDGEPQRPTDRIKAPAQTNGTYIVLAAHAPKRGGTKRPEYVEVGYYEASGPAAAKRAAMADRPANDYLHHSAAQKPGILLRAVPAMHWPHKVEATAFEAGPPALQIR